MDIEQSGSQLTNCCVRKHDANANKPASVSLVTAQVARHGSSGQLFTCLIMSKITYTLPDVAGQLTVDNRNRLNAIS